MFVQLWPHIEPKRRRQFLMLLILMIFSSVAEVFSLGAVVPFLGVLSSPEIFFQNLSFKPLIDFFDIKNSGELLFLVTVIFIISSLAAGLLRLLLLQFNTKLSFLAGADLSSEIYRRTLNQPYDVHISRNSSEIIDGIVTKSNTVIYSIILPFLNLISSFLLLISILLVLFYINPLVTLLSLFSFGLIYLLIMKLVKKRLQINGITIAKDSVLVLKSLQEGLGGIRDILLDGTQNVYCEIYGASDKSLRKAQANNLFIGLSPRFAMEAIGMSLIAILAYKITQKSDGGGALVFPLLGSFALGAQRLLPLLQQSFNSWSALQGNRQSFIETIQLLKHQPPKRLKRKSKLINFKENINFKNISFKYHTNSKLILKNINFNVTKGSSIGFIGVTGSGKSTLLDIFMGLLKPTYGVMSIDGNKVDSTNISSWQKLIAHVPQSIFLSDTTISENIAFGINKNEIDFNRVKLAAKRASIDKDIESWPLKYDTKVGERGVRLSGGQRQRIGIARALYKNAQVIILDEATSALDVKTEKELMKTIDELNKDITCLIVAHRFSTLKNCKYIYELKNGVINKIYNYKQLTNRRA